MRISGWSSDVCSSDLYPVLTPLAIDPAHPFPFVPNKGLCLAMQLRATSGAAEMQGLIQLPQQIGRFVRLPGETIRFIPIEQVLLLFVDRLFPNYRVTGQDRQSVVWGKSVSVRVDVGGRRRVKNKKK